MNATPDTTDLVYSTVNGRICASCGKPAKECICREKVRKAIVPSDGIVRISRETKGRNGKGVTVITGIPLPFDECIELAKELKKRCGCGGTAKNGLIEIQGEHRDLLVEELTRRGFKVKRAGG